MHCTEEKKNIARTQAKRRKQQQKRNNCALNELGVPHICLQHYNIYLNRLKVRNHSELNRLDRVIEGNQFVWMKWKSRFGGEFCVGCVYKVIFRLIRFIHANIQLKQGFSLEEKRIRRFVIQNWLFIVRKRDLWTFTLIRTKAKKLMLKPVCGTRSV